MTLCTVTYVYLYLASKIVTGIENEKEVLCLNFSFNDDVNCEVSRIIERGVQATSAFKEADPVLLERE